VYHSAVTFANAFMHAGTTSDEFLRQNLEWLSRATNWSKFSATAALGVIHKVSFGNIRTDLLIILSQFFYRDIFLKVFLYYNLIYLKMG
jgi:hypothetical protein